jgi:SRSO17 transposase
MDFENPAAWSDDFETFFAAFAHMFQRSETRSSVQWYVRGLLGEAARKNCWQLAESVGLPDPHPLQRVLNEANWEADAVCRQLRQVIDESSVVKKGEKSAGVGRQYCGRVGKVENGQVGVYLGYVTSHGAAFLDRRLYVPPTWFDDRARCHAASIPDTVVFQTKPMLAQAMLAQVWTENLPLQWVTGDTLYGNAPTLRDFIDQADRYYVLALGAHHHVIRLNDGPPCPLARLGHVLDESQWQCFVARLSDHGPVVYDWAVQRIRMPNDQVGDQWLLQRTGEDPVEYQYHLSNAPADTPLADLVTVALAHHSIEQLLAEAKGEVGLADYEVRHWHGWYRHVTLVLLAHTWLQLIQHREREKKAVYPPG